MCSQNPRIFNSVMAGSFGFPFKYLGEEDLPRRGGLSRLRHFIWVSAEFEHTLKNFHDAAAQLGTGFIELSQMVTALLENRFSNASYGQIKLLLVKLESYPNWKKLELGGFIELLAVMDAIPILEDPKAEEKVTVGKTGNEQVA